MSRFILILNLMLLISSPVWPDPVRAWKTYRNKPFGYQLRVPMGLEITKRAQDESGITWQTGTVRLQVSGTKNPYSIKPHEYFAQVRNEAGSKVIEEDDGFDAGKEHWWMEILYTKNSRRVHRKVFIGGGGINTVEFSYGYRYREQKEALAKQVLRGFKAGPLTAEY